MLTPCDPTTNFILNELDESLSAQLCQAAAGPGRVFHSATSVSECLELVERPGADVVFCNSEPRRYRLLLARMQERGLRPPVVVVSRLPEISEWLDALEAGAMDYCAAPFEHRHITWLIESALMASPPALYSYVAQG